MREADVIVCTSVGAADTRLLAACGLYANDDEGNPKSRQKELNFDEIRNAPDGGPPLKIPFVLIDEACQSVEPATLIPILSTNGCRSLVLLGDPCQLPPTVISDSSRDGESPLSISLMSRLATTLPAPIMVTAQVDKTPKENFYLDLKATRQAKSIIKRRSATETVSYRKQFAGSMLLTVQYRMHPSIAAFSSSIFYDGLLSTPAFLSKHRVIPTDFDNVLPIENGSTSVRVVHIGGSNNEKRGDTSSMMEIRSSNNEVSLASESIIPNESISNEAEATKIVGFLKDVLNPETESESPFEGSIGIITPYSAQVILIKSLITQDSELISLVKNRDITIEVNSVDAYQGRECDVILFSAVRSNRQSNVGFLCDWRRMNVALTRAKSGLIVFGDMTTLKAGDKHWEGFYKWAEDLGCVFDVCAVVDTE
jgi:superfamily I DNA and/or RNA helicase